MSFSLLKLSFNFFACNLTAFFDNWGIYVIVKKEKRKLKGSTLLVSLNVSDKGAMV